MLCQSACYWYVFSLSASDLVTKLIVISFFIAAPDSGDVPPSLTTLSDVTVEEGSPAQFRTLVSGTPLPTIQWMREGQIIPPSSDFQVTF